MSHTLFAARLRAGLALLLAGLCLGHPVARAVDLDDLLPVDEAYVVKAEATAPGTVAVHFTIAKGYYLYRHRFGLQPVDPAVRAGTLQIPAGDKHHDQFFGDVETYRDTVTLVLPGITGNTASTVQLKLKYQGCADVGVCYPPQTRTLDVALPASAGSASGTPGMDPLPGTDTGGLAGLAGGSADKVLGAGDALPEDQAFRFEAIANSSSQLLVRLTPAPNYYLYRDKTRFALRDAKGFTLGAATLPAGKPFHDEHFGDVAVWFDQVEIPVPVVRTDNAAREIVVEASFQGCLTDGICYPPMTRTVTVAMPAGARRCWSGFSRDSRGRD